MKAAIRAIKKQRRDRQILGALTIIHRLRIIGQPVTFKVALKVCPAGMDVLPNPARCAAAVMHVYRNFDFYVKQD